MARTKKKTKTPAKKNSKSVAKKKTGSSSKKTAKKPGKKKTARAAGKKRKSPVRKKAASPVNKKTKSAVQPAAIPEAIKPGEDLHSIPADNEMRADRTEEKKKLGQQFENREEVVMHRENQKMKSAMANRQGMKRVFRTTRHR